MYQCISLLRATRAHMHSSRGGHVTTAQRRFSLSANRYRKRNKKPPIVLKPRHRDRIGNTAECKLVFIAKTFFYTYLLYCSNSHSNKLFAHTHIHTYTTHTESDRLAPKRLLLTNRTTNKFTTFSSTFSSSKHKKLSSFFTTFKKQYNTTR
ncbi:unnamed protein product [Aphis gossypii]|uniref:Uncharacterized protein n=1 Tax=Aphis gossypii TaxID=80765 RepID=A0A9P0IJD4_APHGO|nr:unnamed protein product [Aphis gossypii]